MIEITRILRQRLKRKVQALGKLCAKWNCENIHTVSMKHRLLQLSEEKVRKGDQEPLKGIRIHGDVL